MPFKDRTHAGLELSKAPELKQLDAPVVVSMPRGAVAVAIEVARALTAPLSVMPVVEIATPGRPEYVVGAVAENAIHVIDAQALAALGVSEESLAVRVAEATSRIARLSSLYRGDEGSAAGAAGRPVVVVDDGSASAPALEAVAVALARHNVESLWLLTPSPPDDRAQGYERIINPLREHHGSDEIELIGTWYDDRAAPSDEVAAAMARDYAVSRTV